MTASYQPTQEFKVGYPQEMAAISIRGNTLNGASSPLDELSKQTEITRQRVYEAAASVRRIADALFGEVPQPGGVEKSARPLRSGKIGALQEQAEALSAAVGELESQIARIQSIA